MFSNSDVLALVGQAEAQIRALGYPPRVLTAACRAMLLREDGVECPEFIGYWAPSILAAMTTPLTVDECAYAMADLAGKPGRLSSPWRGYPSARLSFLLGERLEWPQ